MNVNRGDAWKIEEALTRHYLRTDGKSGAGPLRFLDATPAELARALSWPNGRPEDILARFYSSFHDYYIRQAFRDGIVMPAPAGVAGPGWFKYLVLTCAIVCMSDEISQLGDFRKRLAAQLDLATVPQDLEGIAALWERLVIWIDSERATGEPYRSIVLPDPGHMTHIGYSRRIAFPARHDLERMRRLFGEGPGESPTTPAVAIRLLRNRIDRDAWSAGFKAAFHDFEEQFRRGQRLIADHPFWVAISRLRQANPQDETGTTTAVDLKTDIDGDSVLMLSTDDAQAMREFAAHLPHLRAREGEFEDAEISIEGLIDTLSRASVNGPLRPLVRCRVEGAIPFGETDLGVWRAHRSPESAKVRFLLRPDVEKRNPTLRGQSGYWFLANPVTHDVATRLLTSLRVASVKEDEIFRVRITDGVKVGSNYLGLPRLLPRIAATSASTLDVKPAADAIGSLAAAAAADGIFQLRTSAPLHGAWTVSVKEGGQLVADLNIAFVPNASEYEVAELAFDERNWRPEMEIDEVRDPIEIASSHVQSPFEAADAETFQFMEAIYAGGRKGWSEMDLISLFGNTMERDLGSAWDILRVLGDAGWLEPRLSASWKARKWFLRAPRLLLPRRRDAVVLDGSICETIRNRFAECVERSGGRVEARKIAGAWSIPTIVGFTDDRGAVCAELGLPSQIAATRLPKVGQTISFVRSQYTERSRHAASCWSWDKARFVKGVSESEGTIQIRRLEHNEHRSNDVYRVIADGHTPQMFDSRAAAILYAHQLAGRPLFRFDRSRRRLERLAREGSLPHSIGTYLRSRHFVGAGIAAGDDGIAKLVYPASPEDLGALSGWLESALHADAIQTSDFRESQLRAAVMRRRRGTAGGLVALRNISTRGATCCATNWI
jgi:hypothetical protein